MSESQEYDSAYEDWMNEVSSERDWYERNHLSDAMSSLSKEKENEQKSN